MANLLEKDQWTFGAGDRERGRQALCAWIQTNVGSELTICDPYFSEDEVWILKFAGLRTNVTVFTSLCQDSRATDELREAYGDAWRRVSDAPPPRTRVLALRTRLRSPPFHDRFLIAPNGGLHLGTSLNQLGSKMTTISPMSPEDADRTLQTAIRPLATLQVFKGEHIQLVSFSIGED
jgi:hypothetical protein